MRCYVTGEECSCGAFDVAGKCPHDEEDAALEDAVFALDDDIACERRVALMSEQLDET